MDWPGSETGSGGERLNQGAVRGQGRVWGHRGDGATGDRRKLCNDYIKHKIGTEYSTHRHDEVNYITRASQLFIIQTAADHCYQHKNVSLIFPFFCGVGSRGAEVNAEGERPASLLFHFVTVLLPTSQLLMNSSALPSPQPPQPTHNVDALAPACLTLDSLTVNS